MSNKYFTSETHPKCVLTIAGSDSSGTAGLQADLKTFEARGVFGSTALTVVTAQATQTIQQVHPLPETFIQAQIEAVLNDIGVDALKTGLLGRESVVWLVAEMIDRYQLENVVVDPVLMDGYGRRFVSDETLAAYREKLFPLATFITPNTPEAALLADMTISTTAEMQAAARRLHSMGARYVLIKGGHLMDEATVVDLIYDGQQFTALSAPRLPIENPRGVGCTLAAALAAELAKGKSALEAAQLAHRYLQAALRGSLGWQVGRGRQPIYHSVDRPPLFEE